MSRSSQINIVIISGPPSHSPTSNDPQCFADLNITSITNKNKTNCEHKQTGSAKDLFQIKFVLGAPPPATPRGAYRPFPTLTLILP